MKIFNTIRLIRPVTNAIEKEVLKEYFRYIGCLFYDAPICSMEEAVDEITNYQHCADINIIFNIDKGFITPLVKEHLPENSVLYLETDPESNAQQRSAKISVSTYVATISETDSNSYFSALLSETVKCVWNLWRKSTPTEEDEEYDTAEQHLKTFVEIFQSEHLFVYLLYKRTFRILNMSDVMGQTLVLPKVVLNPFMKKMLIAFMNVYWALETQLKGSESAYIIYAKVNTARKLKEILNLLDTVSDIPGIEKILQKSTFELLRELSKISDKVEVHLGMLFLSASICQLDRDTQAQAEIYYGRLLELFDRSTVEQIPVFYSFFYYQYGRYLDKVWKEREYARICYERAAQIDSRGYQANFMLGTYHVKRCEFYQAQTYFNVTLDILSQDTSDPQAAWKNISMKAIPYLYKVNCWLSNICEAQNNISDAIFYLWQAATAVEAFKHACDWISEDYQMSNADAKFKTLLEDWRKAHQGGVPVLIMQETLKNNFRSYKIAYYP